MDKFNRYALMACAVMCVIIIGFFYASLALGLPVGGGADDQVNNAATASGGGVAMIVVRCESKRGVRRIWFDWFNRWPRSRLPLCGEF